MKRFSQRGQRLNYVVRLYPKSFPDLYDAVIDFSENEKMRKPDKKVLREIRRKMDLHKPKEESDLAYSQMYVSSKEAEYFNAISELAKTPESRAIEQH